MFTRRKTKGTNERGALMIEAIAMLGLMTMMSPMIVRQTADRHAEMEEVGMANQIKELKKALAAWIASNYQKILKQNDVKALAENAVLPEVIDDDQLAPYLPSGFLEGNKIRGHKLSDSYKIGVRVKCTHRGLDNCDRVQVTGLVLTDGNDGIEDKRAARIASMIGADGGYMLSEKMTTALGLDDGEKSKIFGTQGVWSGKIGDFFDDVDSGKGRVAATTIYSGSFGSDYLYRKKVDGMPDANSMFTDLDMGGHKVNNAGGLQVINGNITIDDNITLSQADVDMNVSTNITMKAQSSASMTVGSVNATLSSSAINMGYGSNQRLFVNKDNIDLKAGSSKFSLKQNSIGINVGGTAVSMNSGVSNLNVGTAAFLMLNGNAAVLKATNSSLALSNNDAALSVTKDVFLNAENFRTNILSNSVFMGKDESSNLRIDANEAKLTFGNQSTVLNKDGVALTATVSNTTTSQIMNASGIVLDVNSATKFSLSQANATIDVNGSDKSMFSNTGFTLSQNTPRIIFNKSGVNLSMFAGGDEADPYIKLATNMNGTVENDAPIAFYTRNGRITGSSFQPELVLNSSGKWVKPVRSKAKLGFVNTDTGQTKAESADTSFTLNQDDATVAINNTKASGGWSPYYLHGGDTKYKRYRVDPAFISVMNDIKQTSRGGARLSEALPNYILKGIYLLTNSYTAGRWPCAQKDNNGTLIDTLCRFYMPLYTSAELGLASGGYEFNCSGGNNHPMKGTCSASNGRVEFNYYKNDDYSTCSAGSYCWAHPFIGKVPAPGYKVTTKTKSGDEVLYAHAEGICPDGYQAVLTLTPNTFEIGRVIAYRTEELITNTKMRYNFDDVDYDDEETRRVFSMIQPSTKIYFQTVSLKDELKPANFDPSTDPYPYTDGDYGWAVAMFTMKTNYNGYPVFNFGGIPANSWTVLAHTYCYFNPNRFAMPNMRFKKISGGSLVNASGSDTDVIITPMENADDR